MKKRKPKKKAHSRHKNGEESKFKSFLGNVKNVVDKQRELDEEKKVQKKKQKQIRPQGYNARKMGVVLFWVVMSLIIVLTLFTLFSKGSEQTVDINTSTLTDITANNVQGVDFAKDFIYTYLNYSSEIEEDYESNLAYYLDTSIDEGLLADSVTNNDYETLTERSDIQLVNSQTTADGNSIFTFRVKTIFAKNINEYENVVVLQNNETNQTNNSSVVENTNEETITIDSSNTSGETIRVRVPQDAKEVVRYIQVHLTFFEDLQRHAVTSYPTYVGFDTTKQVNGGIKKGDKLSKADSEVVSSVEEFLPTFFNSYLNDDKGTLNYILKDENNSVGLVGNNFKYQKINDLEVYNGIEEQEYLAMVEVTLLDNETNIPFVSSYNLVIKVQNDVLIVLKINDLNYLYKLKYGEDSPTIENNHKTNDSEHTQETENEVGLDTSEETNISDSSNEDSGGVEYEYEDSSNE